MQINVKHDLKANVSAEQIWALIGEQFDSVGQWASGVASSSGKQRGSSINGSKFTGRTCQTDIGAVDETITEYNPGTFSVGYKAIASGMPFFVKQLNNRWKITPLGESSCQVSMHLVVDLAPIIGHLMAPLMKMQLTKLTGESVEELIYFATTGQIHVRKVKAQQKLMAKAA
ncbi:SRPBCC family protein [Aliiglaciecola sp. M165]|uniref:SRPBCC family protein n=1 Tax=Aliiglaciecola sp. M165 TaxID=2593649 RepID=UPI00117C3D86|nr:SRPBCC family protein [Aliiglaciecola sp. M165]TRY31958.1 SRPBCC family protein [Aliiglaciecola sp. M165]